MTTPCVSVTPWRETQQFTDTAELNSALSMTPRRLTQQCLRSLTQRLIKDIFLFLLFFKNFEKTVFLVLQKYL